MKWEIKYLQGEGLVTIKTSGTLTDINENVQMVAEALAVAKEHGATKCLLDDRDLTNKIKIIDIYNLPENLVNLGVPRHYKVALIVAESSLDEKEFKFYETRARNTGFKHRLFIDIQKALDWLTGQEDEG